MPSISIGDIRELSSKKEIAADEYRVELFKHWERDPLDEATMVYIRDMCAPKHIHSQEFKDSITDEDIYALLGYDMNYFWSRNFEHLWRWNTKLRFIAEHFWGKRLSALLSGAHTVGVSLTELNQGFVSKESEPKLKLECELVTRWFKEIARDGITQAHCLLANGRLVNESFWHPVYVSEKTELNEHYSRALSLSSRLTPSTDPQAVIASCSTSGVVDLDMPNIGYESLDGRFRMWT